MATHPEVLWAQRSSETEEDKNILLVTVNLPDVIESSLQLDLKPTVISFKALAGDEKKEYAFNIELFKEIDPEAPEKGQEYWPRLTKEKIKTPFIKTDFSRWVDEDEQDGAEAVEDDADMGGMPGGMGGMPGGMGGMPGGMGGMGGMPGMPGGMGGMGGMPGGMDFEKMLASMGGAGGAGPSSGLSGAGDDGSDSDDDGPPPLEDAEAPKP
ncbi:hypothetical protein EW146_g7201 [Bondarzewia mesenterica]|uniref:CS domain-containing protein n=1 Tax=Bondarzewia mesenterica TaxID=1095465 RepID=A0A4S4LND1_9AGAM|nr:hypothetical protein EW146_g7201 [Bondarzewia mesenterica]